MFGWLVGWCMWATTSMVSFIILIKSTCCRRRHNWLKRSSRKERLIYLNQRISTICLCVFVGINMRARFGRDAATSFDGVCRWNQTKSYDFLISPTVSSASTNITLLMTNWKITTNAVRQSLKLSYLLTIQLQYMRTAYYMPVSQNSIPWRDLM